MGSRRFTKLVATLWLALCAGCGGGGEGSSATADTTVPTVSITAPAASATVSGAVAVAASAADDVAVSRVELYVNGVLLGTDLSAPYSFTWDTASLSRGSYTLSTRAYDGAGNVGSSPAVTVTVPIAVAMSTVVSGGTAVGTVFLSGITTPAPHGLELDLTHPAGATIASVTPSGVAGGALQPLPTNPVILAGEEISSGEILRVQFSNVPAGAQAGDFAVSLSAVFDGGGIQIQ